MSDNAARLRQKEDKLAIFMAWPRNFNRAGFHIAAVEPADFG
jgi:hypothetical protein